MKPPLRLIPYVWLLTLLAIPAQPANRAGRSAAPDTTLPAPDSIRYVEYIQTFPARPNSGQATIVSVVGHFPYACGYVSLANARDSGHLVITLRQRDCPDTSRALIWLEAFQIGPLPPGLHHTELELTVYGDPTAPPGVDPMVYRDGFDFNVEDVTPARPVTWGGLKSRYR